MSLQGRGKTGGRRKKIINSESTAMKNKRILIVEDSEDIGRLLVSCLRDMGSSITWAEDGFEGIRLATNENWDLVILDIELPGPSGLEICRTLRAAHPLTSVIMLTSRNSEYDHVLGLDNGADDYITKPFSLMALIARIKAIFRKMEAINSSHSVDSEQIVINSLDININNRQARLSGETLDLTAREFDLLLFFARHPGRVFNRAELLDGVWGYNHDGYEHTVNSHINRLRTKLEADPRNPEYIMTCWGVGYKMQENQQMAV